MKYIKTFESDNWQPWDAIFQKKFGVSKDFILDILLDVRDEFPEIDIWIDDAESSNLVEADDNNENIFVIFFEEDCEAWNRNYLYPLENFIIRSGIVKELNSQLSPHGLKVYTADFGDSDAIYEIVIHKIGTKVVDKTNYGSRYR